MLNGRILGVPLISADFFALNSISSLSPDGGEEGSQITTVREAFKRLS